MKHLSLLLVIVLLFSITSCGLSSSGGTSSEPPENNSTTSCSHNWRSATCTEPKICTKCDETSGTALGHTTDSGVCARCGENFSDWELGEYTDEFEQPTGKKYIITNAYGTFSNSATTNSSLYAALQIDKENIGIMLWEYQSNLVKGTFDYEYYNITIMDEAGVKYYFTGTIYKSGTRVYFEDADRNKVINLLKNNDSIKIYLKSTKYSISSYLFTVETKGFDTAYSSIQ
ncbi:MAG: hypothetical protein IJW48_02690 [Clostridia bacterium]|nr:hypothetical protein [Clostridia bacterium]